MNFMKWKFPSFINKECRERVYILQVNFSGFSACRAELINLEICQLYVKAMEIEEGFQVMLCISNFIKF